MITTVQSGAYEQFVQLEDGTLKSLAQYVKELDSEILAPGAVMLSVHAEVLYHPLLSTVTSPAGEAWVYESSPAGGIKAIYVPTLEQLGADSAQYKLQAKAAVVALDFNATSDNVSVRVIDLSKTTSVAGSAATAALNGENAEQQIESGFFDITPGLAYFVDARKHNDNSALAAAFARQELLIRVVKK